MTTNTNLIRENVREQEYSHLNNSGSLKIFGFWIYLMSDCILFCCLFSTYTVLVHGIAGGPSGKDIFKLPFVISETVLLLLSSFTYSIADIFTHTSKKNEVVYCLILTFLFGSAFIGIECYEFHHLIKEGFGPNRSGFLSAFFALVGTHGLHVISGLIWMVVLIFQITIYGLSKINCTRIMCLSLFWHFVDIAWICVFSFVYLISMI